MEHILKPKIQVCIFDESFERKQATVTKGAAVCRAASCRILFTNFIL
jgi:hypothetical protein